MVDEMRLGWWMESILGGKEVRKYPGRERGEKEVRGEGRNKLLYKVGSLSSMPEA